MNKLIFALSFFLLIANLCLAQVRLVKGVVRNEQDSSLVDSALVILTDHSLYGSDSMSSAGRKSFYYTVTDRNGVFEFKNTGAPVVEYENEEDATAFSIQVIGNNFYEFSDRFTVEDDTIDALEYYLTPIGYASPDTNSDRSYQEKSYNMYTNLSIYGGTLLDSKKYRFNYKVGFSIQKNYKISPVNFWAWDIHPILYRRYYTKGDTTNTSALYPSEYYASVQTGVGTYFRTHLISWNKKNNLVYLDLGAEYNLPWHYWYVGKPDQNHKETLKNFHKYNEVYLNARIGMLKGLALKGQYRLMDIFDSSLVELPRWSVELQAVFLIGVWD